MADVGELVVRIRADAAQLESGLKKANQTTQQSANSISSSLQRLKGRFGDLGLAAGAAFAAITLKQGLSEFLEAERIFNRLEGVIRVTGQAAGFTASEIKAMADEMEKQTFFKSEDIQKAAAALSTYRDITGDTFKRVLELGTDIAEVYGGSVLGSVEMVARALDDPINGMGSLSRRGFKFTQEQKDVIESLVNTGEAAEAQRLILRDLEGQLGGAAEAAGSKGLAGSMDQLDKGLSNLTKNVIEAYSPALKLYLDGLNAIIRMPEKMFEAGNELGAAFRDEGLPANASFAKPRTLSDEEVAEKIRQGFAKSPIPRDKAAEKKIATAREALADYNTELTRQNEILRLTPREQEAVEAKYKTLDLAQKAGIKNSEDIQAANAELARSNYDLNQSMAESARFMQELKDRSTSALTDIAFSFDSAGESAGRFAEAIARIAFEKKIAGPLVDSLFGSGGNPGVVDSLFDSFGGFFADGGRPPVGRPSIVGERGPEIFVPDSAGTVIPNGRMGGTSVIVQQTINMSPGLPETVNAAVMRAAPGIASAAQAAVFQAIERGGAESRLVGRRS